MMLVLLQSVTRYGSWGQIVDVDDEIGAYLVGEGDAVPVADHTALAAIDPDEPAPVAEVTPKVSKTTTKA